MTLYKLIHAIYEPEGAGMDYPILEHHFIGKSREEALGYFHAHLKTDAFLRGCQTEGHWTTVRCCSIMRWETVHV